MKIEMKIPGNTGWKDLGTAFGIGDGCRTSASGDTFGWSFGTYGTYGYGGVIIRITLYATYTNTLSKMTMVFTYA